MDWIQNGEEARGEKVHMMLNQVLLEAWRINAGDSENEYRRLKLRTQFR